ncbi:MAG: hypothetical protein HXY40_16850 [Chloroflexi bacterium]|nr:hypothetical protein [Chloroflexota bacterium]
MARNIGTVLIGKRLETNDLPHQAVSKRVGLAVFASDALSSTAYASEEILLILSLAAASSATMWSTNGQLLGLSFPLAIGIAVLIAIVTMDTFWEQTLHQNSSFIFNLSLSRLEQVVVTTVPFQIRTGDEAENGGEPAHNAQAQASSP